MKNLSDRATIIFPKPLTEEQVKNLFNYLVKNLKDSSIRYTIKRDGIVLTDSETKELYAREYIVSLAGMVSLPLGLTIFNCTKKRADEEEGESESLFYDIKLDTASYSRLEQVPKHDLEAMDKIREKTQEFFKSRYL